MKVGRRLGMVPALTALLLNSAAYGQNYYVSVAGKDTNNGTSTTTPFLTIAKAAALTKPGDMVNVMTGTYDPFIIPNPGSQTGGYITYRAYPGQHPVVSKNATLQNGIQIGFFNPPMSYIKVDGFTVIGNAQSVTAAQAQAASSSDFKFNGSCIDGYSTGHHIVIDNNVVSYCPGAGIQETGDYVTIHHNVVHHNCFWSSFDYNGIVVSGTNSDASTGVKITVDDNRVYNNQNFICNRTETNPCRITDGGGIIVDNNIAAGYTGRVKVFNNVIYSNGNRAISTYHSQHVDVFNNTTFENTQSATEPAPFNDPGTLSGSEIGTLNANDIRVENNILYGNSAVPMYSTTADNATKFTWDYNLLYNGKGAKPIGSHDLVANPKFVTSPPFNFHLQTGSPAINTGTTTLLPTLDFDGRTRAPNADRGAYRAP
jgi:hypothetical protein